MLFDMDSSLAALSPEERDLLADLLEARMTLGQQMSVYTSMQIAYLREQSPAPGREEQIVGYYKDVVAPSKAKVHELSAALLERSVDIDELKGMLPMVLLALAQSINVPLVLAALDIDPDMIERYAHRVREFFESGMK